MEKSDTGCVFRNAVQEQKAAKMYTDEKHKKMEKVYQKIQKEFENSGSTRGWIMEMFLTQSCFVKP